MLWSRFRFRTDWNPQDFVQVNFYTFLAATVRARLGFFFNFPFPRCFLRVDFRAFFLNTFPWHFVHEVRRKSFFSVSVCSCFFKILQISREDLFTALSKTKVCLGHDLRTILFWGRFKTATVCTDAFQISRPQQLELPVGAPKFAFPWHLGHGQKNAKHPPLETVTPPRNRAPPLKTVTPPPQNRDPPLKTVTLKMKRK